MSPDDIHPENQVIGGEDNVIAKSLLSSEDRQLMEKFRTEHATEMLVIVFTDVVGSMALKSKLGDQVVKTLDDEHKGLLARALEEIPNAQTIRTEGDSSIFVFLKPSDAVRFAVRAQQLHREARSAGSSMVAEFRLGIHLGTVVTEHGLRGPVIPGGIGDIKGLQADTTARIMGLAEGGQILCSRAVFDDARQALKGTDMEGVRALEWQSHGQYLLKGREDPIEICEVGEVGIGVFTKPPGSEKARPADRSEDELGWRPGVDVLVPGTDWQIERKLGEGEFGEVWLGRNRSSHETQVYKFCFKRERVAWLKREARLLAELTRSLPGHPSIVAFGDVMTGGDKPPYYLTMEYVDGPSLEKWLHMSPSLKDRLEVIAQVADALDAVHSEGIYHRDVKPSNILLSRRRDGTLQAKLCDFGLGTAEDAEMLRSVYVSRVEGTAGTWDYIAPEIRDGNRATAQSDLYGLGVTLYQVVVGSLKRPLAPGWQREVKSEVLREDIAKCTDSDPGERWSRASDLANALRAHRERLRQRGLEKERETQRRKARRLRVVAGVAGLFSLAVLGLGSYALWQREKAEKQSALAIAEAWRAHNMSYRASAAGARYYLNQQRYGRARELLWQTPEDCRNWEWGFFMNEAHQFLFSVGRDDVMPGDVSDASFTPDGNHVVVASAGDGAIIFLNARTGRPVFSFDYPMVNTICCRPDGTALLAGSYNGSVRVWSLAGDDALHRELLEPGEDRFVSSTQFSSDGMWMLAVVLGWDIEAEWLDTGKDTVLAWNYETGVKHVVATGLVSSAHFVPGSPCDRIVVAHSNNVVSVYNLETATTELSVPVGSPEDLIVKARFTPDGDKIVAVSPWGLWALIDAETGNTVPLDISNNVMDISEVVFSPDGDNLLGVSGSGGLLTFGSLKAGGSADRPTDAPLDDLVRYGGVRRARYSHDLEGSMIVTASYDGTARVWDTKEGWLVEPLVGHDAPVTEAVFSPDHRYVLTVSEDGTAKVWCLALVRGHRQVRDGTMEGGWEWDPRIALITNRLTSGDGHWWLFQNPFEEDSQHVQWSYHAEAVNVDGERTVVSSIQMRNARTGADLERIDCSDVPLDVRMNRPRTHVAALLYGGSVLVWNRTVRRSYVVGGTDDPATCISFDPKGDLLAAGFADGNVALWRLDTMETMWTNGCCKEKTSCVGFDCDSTWVIAGCADGRTVIRNVQDGTVASSFRSPGYEVLAVSFSPDAQRVFTVTGRRSGGAYVERVLTVWCPWDGHEIVDQTLWSYDVADLYISPTGREVVGITESGTEALILTAAPWQKDALPADEMLPWEERFRMWRIKRQRLWLDRTAEARNGE